MIGTAHRVRAGAFLAGPGEQSRANAIHTDPGARAHGFDAGLVAGVDLFAYATTAAVRRWGPGWLLRGTLEVRFRRPVYAGEQAEVRLGPPEPDEEGERLRLEIGTAREPRCAVGSAGYPAAPPPPPDPLAYPDRPPPTVPPPADSATLRPGPLGEIRGTVDAATARWYLTAVAEPLPLYAGGPVHPGLLLRQVNDLLEANVALGPWIHQASRCRLAGTAAVGEPVTTRGRVTREWHRGGRGHVQLDALVLAGEEERPVLEAEHTCIYRL